MDRRQLRTREALFAALRELLAERDYAAISVADICTRAHVGRTTFYAHFTDKDALLDEVCATIFEHVFNMPGAAKATHDFSTAPGDLEPAVAHLLHHIADNDYGVADLLRGRSGELVAAQFRRALYDLARDPDGPLALTSTGDVPASFAAHHLAVSLIGAIHWWVIHGMREAPEQVAAWFVRLVGASDTHSA